MSEFNSDRPEIAISHKAEDRCLQKGGKEKVVKEKEWIEAGTKDDGYDTKLRVRW